MRAWAFAVIALSAQLAAAPAAEQESADDILAAHIRSQGYACVSPKGAMREPARSRPDEQAWVLNCSGARYFVRLIPDMAAYVTPIHRAR